MTGSEEKQFINSVPYVSKQDIIRFWKRVLHMNSFSICKMEKINLF
jgi:hypothetical protein